MPSAFSESFIGLQINWDDDGDEEIEYLGPAVLAGLSKFTATSCKRSGRLINYLYPVSSETLPTRTVLSYRDNPARWGPQWGWEI